MKILKLLVYQNRLFTPSRSDERLAAVRLHPLHPMGDSPNRKCITFRTETRKLGAYWNYCRACMTGGDDSLVGTFPLRGADSSLCTAFVMPFLCAQNVERYCSLRETNRQRFSNRKPAVDNRRDPEFAVEELQRKQ